MYGTENTPGYMNRRMRLETKQSRALESGDYDGFIKARFALLGYSYDDDDSDGGSGSALASITAAAASLGSAYVISSNQPKLVQVPQTTVPAYGAAGGLLASGGPSTLLIVGVLFVGVIVFLFAMD